MSQITDVRTSPRDFVRQLSGANFHRRAKERGMTVRQLLDLEFPEERYNDGLTALGRLMWEGAGEGVRLIPQSDLSEGYYASYVGEFDAAGDGGRFLLHEYLTEVWDNAVNPKRAAEAQHREMQAKIDKAQQAYARSIYESGDQPIGSPVFPYYLEPSARYPQIAPQIPLEMLIAITTPIDAGVYQAFYLTDDATNQRMTRVAQGAELPRAKLTGANHTITLHKYGRAIEVTYEMLRRQRIDLLALHVARIAVQAEKDRVAAALDVAVNGDGNASTAATNYNLTALDSTATVNNLTLKAWLTFKLKFLQPYVMTTVLANDNVVLQLAMLNTGSANIPLAYIQGTNQLGSFTMVNPQLRDGVTVGVISDAPANVIVGFDSRFGLQRIVEQNADLQETEQFISRQTTMMAMSYVDAYAVFDQLAVRTLTLSA